MRIIKNIFVILFPLFLLTVIIRYVNNAGDFDLSLFVGWLKSNFKVNYETFVKGIKDLTTTIKSLEWISPVYRNTPNFFQHSNLIQQFEFYGQFGGYLNYLITLISTYVKNTFTILYCVFGYLYYIIRFIFESLLSIINFTTFLFGFSNI